MDFQARSPKPDPLVILPPRPSSPSHEPPEAFAVPVEPESSRLNIRPGEAVRGRVRDHPQQAVQPTLDATLINNLPSKMKPPECQPTNSSSWSTWLSPSRRPSRRQNRQVWGNGRCRGGQKVIQHTTIPNTPQPEWPVRMQRLPTPSLRSRWRPYPCQRPKPTSNRTKALQAPSANPRAKRPASIYPHHCQRLHPPTRQPKRQPKCQPKRPRTHPRRTKSKSPQPRPRLTPGR